MKKLLTALLAVMLLFASSALAQVVSHEEMFAPVQADGLLTVRFLWLGPQVGDDQPGDCMILTSPDGKVMVLDAGHAIGTEYIIEALDRMNVEHIDYLVASHPHIDHIGGMATLMDRYEIGVLYSTELWHDTATYDRFTSAIKRNKVEQVILSEGQSFLFGDQVEVKVYNPPAEIEYYDGYPTNGTRFMNNHSLVLKFCYGTSTILLAGDLYLDGEHKVVDRWGDALDVDVIKANHHGCSTSSSLKWRKAVSPQITVITSNLIENTDVARRFEKGDPSMYHIFLDGSVSVSTAGDAVYEVKTEKARTTDAFDD